MKIKKYLILLCLVSSSLKMGYADQNSDLSHNLYVNANLAFENQNWQVVVKECTELVRKNPTSSFTQEALFFLSVAYFNLNDLERSNRYLTRYLKSDFSPKYFEEAMHYKFAIAKKYKDGAKKNLFGWKNAPKIVDAEEDAIALFDEIIATMPGHDLACKSMFEKALIQKAYQEYKESVDTLESLVKKFSKHELAAQSRIEIGKIFLKQTTKRQQNPDVLDHANINLAKLKEEYPLEEDRIKELQGINNELHSIFAEGLLNIANFYLKTKKTDAAELYLKKIVHDFPNSYHADIAQKRLTQIQKAT